VNESNDQTGDLVIDFTGVSTGALMRFGIQVERMRVRMESEPAKQFFQALADLAKAEFLCRAQGMEGVPAMLHVPAEVAAFADRLRAGLQAAFPIDGEGSDVL
jgi:hypothetical protein